MAKHARRRKGVGWTKSKTVLNVKETLERWLRNNTFTKTTPV